MLLGQHFYFLFLQSILEKKIEMLLPMSFQCRSRVAPVLLPCCPVLVFVCTECWYYLGICSIFFTVSLNSINVAPNVLPLSFPCCSRVVPVPPGSSFHVNSVFDC